MNADEIFVAALNIADDAERRAYLERACAGDEPLRRELDSLLAAHERIGGFLQKRPMPLAAAGGLQASPDADAAPGAGTPDKSGAPSGKPGDRVGRYKLLEEIGEGGFGTVWMAEQEEPVRRRVALKVIKLGMDTRQVLARFEAERQALALMDHPNIARVFDGGATGTGRPYFVMELVRGLSITKYCDEVRLSTRQRLELFGQVCRAVQHAHQKGIIHRDLKPSNILVTVQDDRPVVKVIDFGIAKATEGRLTDKTLFTGFDQLMGTPAYMSPEQAGLGSLDIDTRSDTYSLGVVLYQLLTGRPPFDTKELMKQGYEAVLRTIREAEPVKPSTRLKQERSARPVSSAKSEIDNPKSEIDQDLDWIVMKCLEKDRARRYETTNALAHDLERYLHDEPVLARPPSALYRWQKFTRKHRTGVAVAAVFLLLLTAATAVSTALALWANRERGRAVVAQTNAISNALAARDSEADAKAVLRFFEEKVLAATMPEGQDGGLGREATIRAAVEAVEPQIAVAFTNRPLVEASIRSVLGKTYFHLGDPARARQHLERALQLRTTHRPRGHSEAIASMNDLAGVYRDLGLLADARRLFEQAVELLRAAAPNDPDIGTLLSNLAAVELKEGQPARAVARFEQALKLQQAQLGEDNPDTLTTMHNLGTAYPEAGQLTNAIPLMEKTLALRRKHLSPLHPHTILSINSLAVVWERAGRRDKALPLYEEAVKLQRDKLGPDHADTLTSINNLAVALTEENHLTNALALLHEALQTATTKFGTNDLLVFMTMNNLSHVYQRAGRLADSTALLAQALNGYQTLRGSNHPQTLTIMNNLAVSYFKAGQHTNALPLLEQAWKQSRDTIGPDHQETLRALNNLAVTYRAAGRVEEAAPLHEQVVQLGRRKLDPDHPQLITWIRNLALDYRDIGRTNDALPLFEETLTRLKTRPGPDHPDTHRAMSELTAAYLAVNRLSDAAGLWRQLLGLQEKKLPADSLSLADTKSRLGDCLLRQTNYAEAQRFLEESLTILKQQQPDRSATFGAQILLGLALLGQKNEAEAEPLLQQGFTGLKGRDADSPSDSRRRLLIEAAERIGQLYEDSGKPDKATEWRAKLKAPAAPPANVQP